MKIFFKDDNDGFYQTEVDDENEIPEWAKGMTKLTEAEADAIRLANQPAPQVPESVTMRQARLALLNAGLLQTVNDAIAAMPGAEGDAARIEWEFSSEVHRNKALVQSLAPVLGLTDTQLDQLFTTAATL